MTGDNDQAEGPDLDRARLFPRSDKYSGLPDRTKLTIEGLHDDDLENWTGVLALVRQFGLPRIRLLIETLATSETTIRNLDGVLKLTGEKGLPKIRSAIEVAEGLKTATRYSRWTLGTCFVVFTSLASLLSAWPSVRDWVRSWHL